jgi:flavodoxin/Pyruvate/2-oxoacid:ferredoxin oxidoreductase delta subunit
MKTVTIFWQSQSGNTFACVKAAADELEKAGVTVFLHHILSVESPKLDTEVYIFAFPVFNFKPASAMKDFINNLPAEVKGKKALIIVSCTGTWSGTPYTTKKLLKRKGLELCGSVMAHGSESYILLRKYVPVLNNGGLPDRKELQKVRKFVAEENKKELKPKFYMFNPLSLFYWLGVISPDNAPGKVFKKKLWDKEKCTLCGYCYELCPSKALTREGDVLKCDGDKCVGCCGCFNICTVSAWTTSIYKKENFYRGEYIKELIKTINKKEGGK